MRGNAAHREGPFGDLGCSPATAPLRTIITAAHGVYDLQTGPDPHIEAARKGMT